MAHVQILKFLESEEMHVTHYGLGLKGTAALIGALEVGQLSSRTPQLCWALRKKQEQLCASVTFALIPWSTHPSAPSTCHADLTA
jgi:hypothetical protein